MPAATFPAASAPLVLVLLLLLAPARPLTAQTATLNGRVLDDATGGPVAGAFVQVSDGGPRAIASAEGVFRLQDVPVGPQRITIQRFGYQDLEVRVTVADPTEPLVARMRPDPVALDGLTVTGGARVALTGTVRDAATGEPLPWAEAWLSRDAQRRAGRAAADAQGVFQIANVETGGYFLRVDRPGYESVFVLLDVGAPPEPVEVYLQPDSTALANLAEMNLRMRSRVNASGFSSRSWGEDRLRLSYARGMRRFLEQDAMLNLMPCGESSSSDDCLPRRGRTVPVHAFIDELLVFGLLQLGTWEPHEFYRVDFFDCGGYYVIRAYTYEYINRTSRRVQALLPPCMIPPLPA